LAAIITTYIPLKGLLPPQRISRSKLERGATAAPSHNPKSQLLQDCLP